MAMPHRPSRAERGQRGEYGCLFDYVQIDSVVIMKIIRHCYEERASIENPRGGLLGLILENRLEITNSFPFPAAKVEEAVDDDYTSTMIMHMKKINMDYFHVGWYQSSEIGSYVSQEFVMAQIGYQDSVEESIVLVYDPKKTGRGFLSFRAFRLIPAVMKMMAETEHPITAEYVKNMHLSFDKMFQEIPVVIKNSPLTNALLCQIVEMKPEDNHETQFLDLGTSSVLEGQLKTLLEKVDDIHQEAYKTNKWVMQVTKQQQDKGKYLHQRGLENAARQAKGEPPLPEEDLTKIFRPIPPPSRIPQMLASSQVEYSCQEINSFCSQALGKLFISEALQASSGE